jgi:serine/threonine protein kinase
VSEGKKYQILKLVAKGGTAVLYKAIQTSLDRVVAVKKLHPHLTEDENFTRRFVLEAKAAASLDHTNIVKIIDFGTEDRLYYMVMDFIQGESLRELLDKWKRIPIDVALAIVHEVLGGLAHAHSKGIVHRDIKPGNIMIAEDGRPRITDFGLAKLLEGSTHQTAADTVLGTPLYMSPEQAFGESVDQRSDLFSLGTMLYEMITGIQPFADDNYMGVINNIAKKNAPHPSRLSVAVPQPVTAILSRAMNKNRDARFQSAGQFQKAIEKYLGHAKLNEAQGAIKHLLTTEGATVQLPATALAEERKSRLRRGLMAAVAVVTLFGAAGVGYTLAPEDVQYRLSTTVRGWFDGRPRTHHNIQTSDMGPPGAYLNSLLADSAKTPPGIDTATEPPTHPGANTATPPAPRNTTPTTTQPASSTSKPPAPEPPASSPQAQVDEPEESPEKIETGWLSVASEPHAEVYVNNKYMGDTPLKVELPPGTHRLECRSPSFETYRENVNITRGELSRRSVSLKKLSGHIVLTATEGAEVLIDGVVVGVTPLKDAIKVDVGRHQVTVKKAGYNVWNNQITVSADQRLPLNIMLSPLY